MYISSLSREILVQILTKTWTKTIHALVLVCRLFKCVVYSDFFWYMEPKLFLATPDAFLNIQKASYVNCIRRMRIHFHMSVEKTSQSISFIDPATKEMLKLARARNDLGTANTILQNALNNEYCEPINVTPKTASPQDVHAFFSFINLFEGIVELEITTNQERFNMMHLVPYIDIKHRLNSLIFRTIQCRRYYGSPLFKTENTHQPWVHHPKLTTLGLVFSTENSSDAFKFASKQTNLTHLDMRESFTNRPTELHLIFGAFITENSVLMTPTERLMQLSSLTNLICLHMTDIMMDKEGLKVMMELPSLSTLITDCCLMQLSREYVQEISLKCHCIKRNKCNTYRLFVKYMHLLYSTKIS